MIRINNYIFIIIYFAFLTSFVYGNDLASAQKLEKTGETAAAVKYYTLWMEKNHGNPEYFNTLKHTLNLITDTKNELDLLSANLSSVKDPASRYYLFKRIAILEEKLGFLDNAQKHYEIASHIDPGNKDFHSFLNSALLLYETGDEERSEAQANTLVRFCKDTSIVFQGKILLGRIYLNQNRGEELSTILYEMMAEIGKSCKNSSSCYGFSKLLRQAGKDDLAVKIEADLKKNYPGSAEAALIARDPSVETYPSPGLFFEYKKMTGNENKPSIQTESPDSLSGPETVSIQTGSFSVKENAEYMVKDLKNIGFPAIITEAVRNGKTFYKVVIPSVSIKETQKVLIQLKEENFEGFLIFK